MPGDQDMERRIRALIRLECLGNGITRANKTGDHLGGHLASFFVLPQPFMMWALTTSSVPTAIASAATLSITKVTVHQVFTRVHF